MDLNCGRMRRGALCVDGEFVVVDAASMMECGRSHWLHLQAFGLSSLLAPAASFCPLPLFKCWTRQPASTVYCQDPSSHEPGLLSARFLIWVHSTSPFPPFTFRFLPLAFSVSKLPHSLPTNFLRLVGDLTSDLFRGASLSSLDGIAKESAAVRSLKQPRQTWFVQQLPT